MGPEFVEVIVGGMSYSGWTSVSINYSAQSAERSFEVVASDEAPDLFSAAWVFEPGTPVQIKANGTLVVAGYINELTIDIEKENHELRVGGRSKGQDCHDCTPEHKTYEWRNKTIEEIANDLGLSVKFNAKEPLKKIPVARAQVGEKAYTFINRLARSQGLFITGTPDGDVDITKHGKLRHAGAIQEGVNMEIGSATFSDRDRHEKYKVKGQTPTGTGENSTEIEETATDSGARKGRILHIMPDITLDKWRAKERAEQVKRTRQGNSVKATFTLQGWRDDGGTVWEAGWLIWCQSKSLRLSQDMAISSVELRQDNNGSFAKLDCVDPRALGGKGGKGKSAKAYGEGLE